MSQALRLEATSPLSYNTAAQSIGPSNGQGSRPNNIPGDIWLDVDPTLGVRKFKMVTYAAGAAAAPVTGSVLVWTDNYALVGDSRQAQSARNCLLGVTQASATVGNLIWVQTDGYHAGVVCDGSTFALGTQVMISGTDVTATTVGTAGTAPTYPVIGTALGTSASSKVACHLHCGKFGLGGF